MICLFTCARSGAKPSVCPTCNKCPHLCRGCQKFRRVAAPRPTNFPPSISHRFANAK